MYKLIYLMPVNSLKQINKESYEINKINEINRFIVTILM